MEADTLTKENKIEERKIKVPSFSEFIAYLTALISTDHYFEVLTREEKMNYINMTILYETTYHRYINLSKTYNLEEIDEKNKNSIILIEAEINSHDRIGIAIVKNYGYPQPEFYFFPKDKRFIEKMLKKYHIEWH